MALIPQRFDSAPHNNNKGSLTYSHTKHSIERQTSINNKTYTNLNPSKITWYKPILLLEEKKSGCKSIGDLRCENKVRLLIYPLSHRTFRRDGAIGSAAVCKEYRGM